MPNYAFLKLPYQAALALSDDSEHYAWFEEQYGGLEDFPESRCAEDCYHPRNPHFEELRSLVNGFQFHESIAQRPLPRVEGYIPQIFPRNSNGIPPTLLGSHAVQYHQVRGLFDGSSDPKSYLGNNSGAPKGVVVLTGNSKDPKVEKVWHASYQQHFWRQLRRLHRPVLVSPDFSVYTRYPSHVTWRQGRFEQVWNMKRSLDFCRRATEKGFCCALTLSFAIKRDVERWCAYLREPGQGIHLLAMNVQTLQESAKEIPNVILGIEESVGREFEWIIQGIGSKEAFKSFKAAGVINRVTFISTAEQMLAFYRRDLGKVMYKGADPQKLLVRNIFEKRQMLHGVVHGIEPLPFLGEQLQAELSFEAQLDFLGRNTNRRSA